MSLFNFDFEKLVIFGLLYPKQKNTDKNDEKRVEHDPGDDGQNEEPETAS